MVESSGKTSNVSDNTTTDNEDWLVSGNTVLFHIKKNFLNIFHILVCLISWMDQLGEWNLMGYKVVLKFLAVVFLNLVIDESDTSSEWLVNISKNSILVLENTSGDLDCRGDVSSADRLNGLGIFGGQADTIACSVNAGWVDSVRVNLLKSNIISEVLLCIVPFLRWHVVFDSGISKFLLFEQLINLLLHSFDGR